MTSESTGSQPNTFNADSHDEETKKSYYHLFDDESVNAMKKYYKVEDDHDALLRYLKHQKVPKTTPDHV
jgi:hypothetical protein